MGMMKNYLLELLQQCSEEKFGQDAIEWSIVSGLVRLTYDSDRDIRECMSRYDEIIEGYRRALAEKTEDPAHVLAPMERAVPWRRNRVGVSDSAPKKRHVG
jgi:hypothetical protein